MLAYLILSVSTRCEQIFRENGEEYDCGVGVGWLGLAAMFVGTGIYSGWMLYRMEGTRG
jgi:hypothetical protein